MTLLTTSTSPTVLHPYRRAVRPAVRVVVQVIPTLARAFSWRFVARHRVGRD